MADDFQTNVAEGTLRITIPITRLDAAAAAGLKPKLQFPLDAGIHRAEVDLGTVQFIDSSGIGVLLGIYRRLPKEGSVVVLQNVQPAVVAVLELLRLHRVFQIG